MGRRFALILAVASVLGLATASMVYQAIIGQRKVEANAKPAQQVAVAAANINLGETLTPRHVKLVAWPTDSVPGDALHAVDEADGRVALASIVVGEPLLNAKLAPKHGGGGILPMLVPDNLRGVTIKVDEAVRESGFVSPNSRVDIIVTINDPRDATEKKAKVILQNIPVLAAGQTVEMKGNKPVSVTTVTLALTPEQSERLALAKAEGQLLLATRKLGDNRIVRTGGTDVNRLLGELPIPLRKHLVSSAAPLPDEPPQPYRVVVFRGNKMTEQQFTESGSQWVSKPGRGKAP